MIIILWGGGRFFICLLQSIVLCLHFTSNHSTKNTHTHLHFIITFSHHKIHSSHSFFKHLPDLPSISFLPPIHRNIAQVSNALRAEFARGDGRVKKKEDERRKKILPNETLFVVNFHEETTKREDLQMLFEPFGELVRIDMKRNYAFVQFKTVEESIRAKEATNGGKLDQSEITVEFVARRMGEGGERRGGGRRYDDRGDRGGRGGGGGYRGGRDDYRPRRDDYRPRRYDDRPRRDYDDRRRSRSRSRSPGYRRRSRR